MLSDRQAAKAWGLLAAHLECLGDKDVPKFNHLLNAIRRATIHAHRFN